MPRSHQEADNKIIVSIKACALNPVDIQLINLPRKRRQDTGKEWGIANDFSGHIIKAEGFDEGEEVYGMSMSALSPIHTGTLATVAILDAKSTILTRKPKRWTHEEAASIPLVWLTAKKCTESVRPSIERSVGDKAGKLVVLGGSSSVGMYTIMLAKQAGWQVLTTSSKRNKALLQEKLKVDNHVDYTAENTRQKVTAFKPNAIIDCVGGIECIGIPGNSRYITIVGDKTGRDIMGGPFTYYDLRSPIFAIKQWVRWARGCLQLGESYDIVHLDLHTEWLEEASHKLDVGSIHIDSIYPFKEAQEAFKHMQRGRTQGKVIVRVQ